MDISAYIKNIYLSIHLFKKFNYPWDITDNAEQIIRELIENLSTEFIVRNGIAIHKSATVESPVTLKAPVVVGKNCFIAAGSYLRGGVFFEENVRVGPGCEVKSSFIFKDSTLAHFNYVGNSLIGSRVNIEAGAVIANHFNEREDKTIRVKMGEQEIIVSTEKFGALVGDNCKIGANSVLSPGTILRPKSLVGRLELVKGL